jgi:hypothetical protein
MKKEKIIKRIKALLLKTSDNGCTQAEYEAATKKIAELMRDYSISDEDLFTKGYDVMELKVVTDMSGPDIHLFVASIANVFDCVASKSRVEKEISFYGYKDDVELCFFMFEQIELKCDLAVKKYKREEYYNQNIKRWGSGWGRSAINSFRKGFYEEMGNRLRAIYEQRYADMQSDNRYALVSVDKVEKANEKRNETAGARTYRPNSHAYGYLDRESVVRGKIKAEETELQQGIKR